MTISNINKECFKQKWHHADHQQIEQHLSEYQLRLSVELFFVVALEWPHFANFYMGLAKTSFFDSKNNRTVSGSKFLYPKLHNTVQIVNKNDINSCLCVLCYVCKHLESGCMHLVACIFTGFWCNKISIKIAHHNNILACFISEFINDDWEYMACISPNHNLYLGMNIYIILFKIFPRS